MTMTFKNTIPHFFKTEYFSFGVSGLLMDQLHLEYHIKAIILFSGHHTSKTPCPSALDGTLIDTLQTAGHRYRLLLCTPSSGGNLFSLAVTAPPQSLKTQHRAPRFLSAEAPFPAPSHMAHTCPMEKS